MYYGEALRTEGADSLKRVRRPPPAHLTQQENKMKIVFTATLAALLSLSAFAAPQNANMSTAGNANANAAKKRAAPFRANKDQITQAQTILKQRGFYTG